MDTTSRYTYYAVLIAEGGDEHRAEVKANNMDVALKRAKKATGILFPIAVNIVRH